MKNEAVPQGLTNQEKRNRKLRLKKIYWGNTEKKSLCNKDAKKNIMK